MEIKVNRKNLLESAALCAKLVIPSKSPLESLPNLRLTASTKLHTTELLASNGAETIRVGTSQSARSSRNQATSAPRKSA